jgi:hypothetical protein
VKADSPYPDPVESNIVWATASGLGSVGGIVDRFNEKTRHVHRVEIWPDNTVGWPAEELEYRFQWTFPLAMSPHDRNTIYAGSQMVHRTTNGGGSWERISSDLTLNDKERQLISGGLNPDNVGVEYAGVVFAIAESPREKGTLWAGTNDGRLHDADAGQIWSDVTGNIRLSALGHGQQHRALALRFRYRLYHRRSPPGETTATLRLQDDGLWAYVEVPERHGPA